tara:strand:- start:565 stop:1065 length:501 start_codon:yes stop_codon:yes gene_type:complete
MDADMMTAMPVEAMGGMDADMMEAMPPTAMEGMGPDMIAAAPPGVMDAAGAVAAGTPNMDDGGMGALGDAFAAQGVDDPMAAPDPAGTTPPPGMEGMAPPPGLEGDPMGGLDAALGSAMDQATDQGAGAGAPDIGVPPDAGTEAPMMDDPDASESDIPPPDVGSIV